MVVGCWLVVVGYWLLAVGCCEDVTPAGHAGVSVVSLHGAPLSLPTLSHLRGVLSIRSSNEGALLLGNGGFDHLFVIPRG